MAKEPTPSQPPSEPTSETVRVAADVMAWLRYVCFHERALHGKRLKMTELLDSLIREPAKRRYEDLRAEVETSEGKPKKGGKS